VYSVGRCYYSFCSSGLYDAFLGDLIGCFLVGRGWFYGFYLVVVLFCYGRCMCLLLLLLLLFLVFVCVIMFLVFEGGYVCLFLVDDVFVFSRKAWFLGFLFVG
jgi:hypothetical protein